MHRHDTRFGRLMAFLLAAAVGFSMTVLPAQPAFGMETEPVTGFAGDADIRYKQDFSTITDISEDPVFSIIQPTDNMAYAKVEDQLLKFGKTTSGKLAGRLNAGLSEKLSGDESYLISFDMKIDFTDGLTVNVLLGGCAAFRNQGGGKCTFEWYDPAQGGWDKSDQNLYDFSGMQNVKLVVKARQTVDFYVGGSLVQADIPQRDNNVFDKLGLELGNSLTGEIWVDNLLATADTTVVPPDQPTDPDQLYGQDFSGISDISEDPAFELTQNTGRDSYASVETGALKFGKTGKGSAILRLKLEEALSGTDDYAVCLNLRPAFPENLTLNIGLGGCIAIRTKANGKFSIEWHDGSSWVTTDTTEYDVSELARLKLVVRGRETLDVYLGDQPVRQNIPQRASSYLFTEVRFELGNSLIGDVWMDDILVTRDTGTEPPGGPVLYRQDFSQISDVTEDDAISVTHNAAAESYADITPEETLHFGKAAKGLARMELNFMKYLQTFSSYRVSLDVKADYRNSTVNMYLGGCFAFRSTGETGKYTFEWHDGSKWVSTDTTQYDLSEFQTLNLLVKDRSTVDVYLENRLLKADIPQRDSNVFTKMILDLSDGTVGSITLDNLLLSTDVTPPEPPENPVLYEQNFSDISDLAEDAVFVVTQPTDGNAHARIENQRLQFGKTTTGAGVAKLDLNLAERLKDLKNYLVSFTMQADFLENFTVNIALGGCFALRSKGAGNYSFEWFDQAADSGKGKWDQSDLTLHDLSTPKKFQIVVKDGQRMDVYLDGVLLKADIPQRSGDFIFSRLRFELGNSLSGDIYLDQFLVTTDIKIDEPGGEIENAVTEDTVPTVGAPGIAKENFDLYLAIGQSNMAGRAALELEDRIFIPNAYLFNGDGKWETAQAQFFNGKWSGMNRYSTVQKSGMLQGLSPAFYFAKALAEQVGGADKKIGIISNARGDTSIDQWQKGYTDPDKDFDLYEEAVARTRAAMEAGTLKGIIWHQGCADLAMNPSQYNEKFKAMTDNLRTDLGVPDLPIIIGEIPGYGASEGTVNYRMKFNQQCVAKLPDVVKNCWYVNSAGSRDIGDKTHFDAASQRRMGSLYGRVALREIYGIQAQPLNQIPMENPAASDSSPTAVLAADGNADVHTWDDAATYWTGPVGTSWSAEFGEALTVREIKSYFLNPYHTVYRYKVFLRQAGQWVLTVDNSAIRAYANIDEDGAVEDTVEDVLADGIRVQIVGALDYDGNASSAPAGCHEFAVYTPDSVSGTRVSFRGYSGAAQIPVTEADTLTLEAQSPDGIREIRVYADGALYKTLSQEPYLLDITPFGIRNVVLRAVAVSKSGETGQVRLNLAITADLSKTILEDSDFTGKSQETLDSGIILLSQRGYVKTAQIDAEHGDSLLVGIETVNPAFGTGSLPFINIPLGGIGGSFTISCDMYVDAKEDSGDKKMTIYQASGNETIALQFKDRLTAGNQTVDYDTGKWYHYRIDVNIAEQKMDIYRDGVLLASGAGTGKNLTVANYVRLYGPRNDTVPSFTAIDNLKIARKFEVPEILSIGDDNIVQADAPSFTVKMSGPLNGRSISDKSVFILDTSGTKMAVRSAEWSDKEQTIVVTPGRRLASNSDYTLVFGEDVQVSDGVPVGSIMTAAFQTDLQGVEVDTMDFTMESGRKNARVTLRNATGETKNVFVVMTLWDGTRFCGMDIKPCTVAGNGTVETELSQKAPDGAVAELYLYDSLAAPNLLNNRIYHEAGLR